MKRGLALCVLGVTVALSVAPAWSAETPSPTTATIPGLPETPDCTGPGIQPPTVANSHAATQEDYPPLSVALGEQGLTVVAMIIREDGSASNIEVVKSSGFARLDEAAASTVVPRWKYRPATKNGKPVACPWKASVSWMLSGAATPGPMATIPITLVPMGPENYTDVMRAHGEQGVALVFALVSEDGRIISAAVANSSGFPDIDAASLKIVQSGWHFKPAEAEGRPLRSFVAIAFSWSLTPGAPPITPPVRLQEPPANSPPASSPPHS